MKNDMNEAIAPCAPSLPPIHLWRARRVSVLLQQLFEVVDDRVSGAMAAEVISRSPRDWHLCGDFALLELLLLRGLAHLTQVSEGTLERELDAKEGRPR